MATTPWYTSNSLISAIKRKISFPISQNTFSEDDLLAFANEEMMISQVPSIMTYHEEYFVATKTVTLQDNVSKYAVPDRAIGQKLRDVFWQDQQGNLFEMTRIPAEDKSFFNANISTSTDIHKFYIENNSVVLVPTLSGQPAPGRLRMYFFIRPNQLVVDSHAATVSSFKLTLTIQNNATIQAESSNIVVNNTSIVPIVGPPPITSQFQIGATAAISATNMAAAITATLSVSEGITAIASGAVVTITSTVHPLDLTFSDAVSYIQSVNQELVCSTTIPSDIVAGTLIDILQTNPGHLIIDYNVPIPAGGVSGSSIFLADADVPSTMIVGDYICNRYECIIPMIPPDLHNGLAERACARIFEALGDTAGLQLANAKIADMEQKQNTLIDNRVEGSALKVNGRHSMLRYNANSGRRRF